MKRALFGLIAVLALVALGIGLATAQVFPPQVLVIFHGYDGPVETAGDLINWQYTRGRMLVEYTDLYADGIFRNGFEAKP